MGCDSEKNLMLYLLAHGPMFACNHKNLVCSFPAENILLFEPNVLISAKCANCGQVFRESADELEMRQSPVAIESLG